MTVATWLHLAGLHLDIDPEYEVTSDLASQHPTCVNQKVLRREVVFIAIYCVLVWGVGREKGVILLGYGTVFP